jgi:hypothetical protein
VRAGYDVDARAARDQPPPGIFDVALETATCARYGSPSRDAVLARRRRPRDSREDPRSTERSRPSPRALDPARSRACAASIKEQIRVDRDPIHTSYVMRQTALRAVAVQADVDAERVIVGIDHGMVILRGRSTARSRAGREKRVAVPGARGRAASASRRRRGLSPTMRASERAALGQKPA